jgi:hypothetical protein
VRLLDEDIKHERDDPLPRNGCRAAAEQLRLEKLDDEAQRLQSLDTDNGGLAVVNCIEE